MNPQPPPPASVSRFDPQRLAALGNLGVKVRYLVEGFLAGQHRSPFRGFSVEFSEYRDYQPGDDLRHLDWRLYARNDRLCVREFEEETNVRAYLVVDGSGSMAYRGDRAWAAKIECARALAAALAWLMLRQKDATGLLASGADAEGRRAVTHIPPSQKSSQFGQLVHHLERLQADGESGLDPLLARANELFHRRSVVAIFTDLLDPATEVAARVKELRFHGHDCFVFQILDRDEIEFPFEEAGVFQDLETGVLRQVVPDRARARYLERFEAFLEPYRRLFRDLAIPHEIIRTDADPYHAMARFLAARRRKM
jgi:uncharacterized protein (DUF58 family)